MVPRRNLAAAYKVETVRKGIEDMLTEYKDMLMEDMDLPSSIKNLKIHSSSAHFKDDTSSLASTEADSSLADDISDAKGGLKNWPTTTSATDVSELPTNTPASGNSQVPELEGTTPLVEMDASRPIAELPAEVKKGQMEDVSTAKKPHELPA